MTKTSAGLLMYRKKNKILEVFLVHPGGPFFKSKDTGCWGIPKGERHDNEDLLSCAKREFAEETNITVPANAVYCELGSTTYSSGKIVYCWAFENNVTDKEVKKAFKSNPIQLGNLAHRQAWPENDRGEFFNLETALLKIFPAQKEFLTRLTTLNSKI